MSKTKNSVNITRIILGVIKMAGLLSVAIVAPNVIGALDIMGLLGRKKYHPANYINERVQSMISLGLLRNVHKNGKFSVELTEKGEIRLKKYQLIYSNKDKKGKWDGYWRVLVFDVWEKRRGVRDILRRELKSYGFIQMQRSVWIYPYPCSEFIELLKSDLRFGKNVRYMVVKKLDGDSALKRHFKI